MRKSSSIYVVSVVFAIAMLLLGGCAKKPAAAKTVPPPPQPNAPTVALTATPQSVEKGQPVELSWQTQDATQIVLEGIGPVSPEGTRRVIANESTTYTLRATGPGGSKEATAQVTVTLPPVSAAQGPEDINDLIARNVKDIFFGYDDYKLNSEQSGIVTSDAKFLAQHPEVTIVIEGHCDERGSEEYNLALGDNRAQSVKSELVKLGVKPDQIKLISYGKEKPFCSDENEQCWQQNRRAHFSVDR